MPSPFRIKYGYRASGTYQNQKRLMFLDIWSERWTANFVFVFNHNHIHNMNIIYKNYTIEIDHCRVACFTVHLPSPVRCTSDLKCSSFAPRLVFNSRWKCASSSLSCNKDSGTHKSDSGGGLGSAPTAHASELRSCNTQIAEDRKKVKHKTITHSKCLVTGESSLFTISLAEVRSSKQ